MTKGIVFDIKRYAIHDGPGIRTTVFLKGCPLQCWWCHNPEGLADSAQRLYNADRCIGCGACIDACPQNALSRNTAGIKLNSEECDECFKCATVCPSDAVQKIGREVSVAELMQTIERDRLFYDESGGGVTISGGEPFSQADFLLELLTACGLTGIHRAVDTSGYADPDQMLAVARQTDLFLFDLKLMDVRKHRKYTGMSNEIILENLEMLTTCGANVVVRIPVIPGVNADDDNMRQTARFLTSRPGIQKVHLLSYHCTARKKYRQLGIDFIPADTAGPTSAEIRQLAATLESYGLQVSVGG